MTKSTKNTKGKTSKSASVNKTSESASDARRVIYIYGTMDDLPALPIITSGHSHGDRRHKKDHVATAADLWFLFLRQERELKELKERYDATVNAAVERLADRLDDMGRR